LVTDKDIGIRLRARREELGIKQGELADRLGVSQQTVSRWESGDRGIVVTDLPAVAKALYVAPGYFLEDEPDQARDPSKVTYEPIMDEVQVAASRGTLTPAAVEDIKRFVRFRSQEELEKRGGG